MPNLVGDFQSIDLLDYCRASKKTPRWSRKSPLRSFGPLVRQETKSPKPAGVKEDLNLQTTPQKKKRSSPNKQQKRKGKSCRITKLNPNKSKWNPLKPLIRQVWIPRRAKGHLYTADPALLMDANLRLHCVSLPSLCTSRWILMLKL